MKLELFYVVPLLSLLVQFVTSQNQNFDLAKFAQDAGKLLQTAVTSFSSFKPDDWMKLFQGFMDKDDQKVAIEVLEGLLQGLSCTAQAL